MKYSKKSQLSAEFIVVLGAIMILFLIIFSIVQTKATQTGVKSESIYAQGLVERLGVNINTIFLSGNSVEKTVELPEKLDTDANYSISIIPAERIVKIEWTNREKLQQKTFPLLTSDVTGTLSGISGDVILTNTNGGVIIG